MCASSFCLKSNNENSSFIQIAYPKNVYLLRGNHECRSISTHFTFRQEVIDKFDQNAFDVIMETFDALPLIAIVNSSYICCHGGISPSFKSLEDVNAINRFQEIPVEGLACDLVWSDPIEDENALKVGFAENTDRACSFKYGLEPVKKILDDNDFTLLIRAH
jgi:serine/threonine-protein phosphatase 2B catalytic subunit